MTAATWDGVERRRTSAAAVGYAGPLRRAADHLRADSLPDPLRELMRAAMADALAERARIPEEEHREHHEWVQAQIERQRARTAFWTALAQKSAPAIVWTLLAAAGGWVWSFLRSHITWN